MMAGVGAVVLAATAEGGGKAGTTAIGTVTVGMATILESDGQGMMAGKAAIGKGAKATEIARDLAKIQKF